MGDFSHDFSPIPLESSRWIIYLYQVTEARVTYYSSLTVLFYSLTFCLTLSVEFLKINYSVTGNVSYPLRAGAGRGVEVSAKSYIILAAGLPPIVPPAWATVITQRPRPGRS